MFYKTALNCLPSCPTNRFKESLTIHSFESFEPFHCVTLLETGWSGEVASLVYGQLYLSGTICPLPFYTGCPASSLASGTECCCVVLKGQLVASSSSCSNLQSCRQGYICRNTTLFLAKKQSGAFLPSRFSSWASVEKGLMLPAISSGRSFWRKEGRKSRGDEHRPDVVIEK